MNIVWQKDTDHSACQLAGNKDNKNFYVFIYSTNIYIAPAIGQQLK